MGLDGTASPRVDNRPGAPKYTCHYNSKPYPRRSPSTPEGAPPARVHIRRGPTPPSVKPLICPRCHLHLPRGLLLPRCYCSGWRPPYFGSDDTGNLSKSATWTAMLRYRSSVFVREL